MRESGTIGGSNRVDTAFVVGAVQKLAGNGAVHPVAIPSPLLFQVFLLKGAHGHSQVFGDTLLVGHRVGRGHGLAAIGAGQAIDLFPNTRDKGLDACIDATGFVLRDASKEPTKCGSVLPKEWSVGLYLMG